MSSTVSYLLKTYSVPKGALPHLALPPLLIGSLFSPPFRGRGILFAVLIVATDWACAVSPWPPNTVAAYRGMRYGLACSWIFVLPVLERILIHIPERDFRRVDGSARPIPPPSELSLGKLRWATALVATPRGVGWDFGRGGYAKSRVGSPPTAASRRMPFVVSRFLRAALAYLATDAVLLASKMADIPSTVETAWAALTLPQLAYWEVLMLATVYCNMEMQYHSYAAVDVALFRGLPEDWPALFGDVTQCYTVGNIWGKFWHDYLRQPALGFSNSIIGTLNFPRRSKAAYLIHLVTAFGLSALVHVLSIAVVTPKDAKVRDVVRDLSIFFMVQPPLVMIETSVMALYKRYMSPMVVVGEKQVPRSDIRSSQSFRRVAGIVSRALGYLWVMSTTVPLGWFFLKVYYVSHWAMDWPVPYPVAERFLTWYRQNA